MPDPHTCRSSQAERTSRQALRLGIYKSLRWQCNYTSTEEVQQAKPAMEGLYRPRGQKFAVYGDAVPHV